MITQPEIEGLLTHALPEENQWPAARSPRHAKRMDVPYVGYEKLASDRAGEASEAAHLAKAIHLRLTETTRLGYK